MFKAVVSAKQCSSVATVPVMREATDVDTMIACCSSIHETARLVQWLLHNTAAMHSAEMQCIAVQLLTQPEHSKARTM
jgi:hypothetical protein